MEPVSNPADLFTFGVGTRVKTNYRGKEVHGTVSGHKRNGNLVVVIDDVDGQSLVGPRTSFKPSDVPAPATAPRLTYAKGDRVETLYRGVLKHGTVTTFRNGRVTALIDGGVVSLDYAPLDHYLGYWRSRGAKVGRVVGGQISWDA